MEQTTPTTPRQRRSPKPKKLNWRLYALILLAGLIVLAVILRLTDKPKQTAGAAERLEEIAAAAKESVALPAGYHRQTLPEEMMAQGTLVLVNNDCRFDPDTVTDLVSVYLNKTEHYEAKDWVLSVDPRVSDALNKWLEAGYEKNEFSSVNVVAGYRSYQEQQTIYDNAVASRGEEYAKQYINQPGASEHHTGLAVDLSVIDRNGGTTDDFNGAGKQTWLREHAWEFGLILRYPPEKVDITGIDFESWHYRYVGLPHAKIIAENNLCLDEYIELLRQHPFDGEHLTGTCNGKPYDIYYCAGSRVILPDDESSYTISGNNVDGYIITIYDE